MDIGYLWSWQRTVGMFYKKELHRKKKSDFTVKGNKEKEW